MEVKWNKLLQRQIKRHFGSAENLPAGVLGLLEDINHTYDNFNEDNQLLQNSIEISSQELREAFQKQKQDAEYQKQTLKRIREAIQALDPDGSARLKDNEESGEGSSSLFNSLLRLIVERNTAVDLLKQKTEEMEAQNEELNQSNAQLVAARIQAEESDRLKSAFLANMSHEIRTPINGILGFAELLKEPGLSDDQKTDFIAIIEKSGGRMLNLISDIICISKVEAGQMEVSVNETNIGNQIEHIYDLFRNETELKGLSFTLVKGMPSDESIIRTDREKVTAILVNLVNNAIKFTASGSITIGYAKKDNYLELFVKDTGVGIRQDQKEFIFERFRQGQEELNRNYEGTGLGLSISKAYVEMLGGKIWVESEEGKGSAFFFTLPCLSS
jgi:signal transduction histidine kinase